MFYLTFSFLFGVVVGLAAVASNPSPYFAAVALVMTAGLACGVLNAGGAGFLSLILFLIYLGGMMVVFSYCAALIADPHPQAWSHFSVVFMLLMYILGCVLVGAGYVDWCGDYISSPEVTTKVGGGQGDAEGVALVYYSGGPLLLAAAWTLLVTLFAVVEVVWVLGWGALRSF